MKEQLGKIVKITQAPSYVNPNSFAAKRNAQLQVELGRKTPITYLEAQKGTIVTFKRKNK